MRICGLVVRPRPGHLQALQHELRQLPGVEIHAAQSDAARLIVTVEDVAGHSTADTLIAVQRAQHAVCVTLAYEYSDDANPSRQEAQPCH